MNKPYELPHSDLSKLMTPDGYERFIKMYALLQIKYAKVVIKKENERAAKLG